MNAVLTQRKYDLGLAAGSAAGAVMARSNARILGAALAGLVISALLLRTIPFRLLFAAFSQGGVDAVEYPGSEELFAPFDAGLTVLFVLVVWFALARAPLPPKQG